MKMKYIIVEIDGKQVPVMFGEDISHKAMFRGVQLGLRQDRRDGGEWRQADLVSAGFVDGLTADGVYGESESLRYGSDYIPKELHHLTKSKPEDLSVINGGRSLKAVEDKREIAAKSKDEQKLAKVIAILKKTAPEARHKSPPGRWDAAQTYLMETHQMSGTDAHNFIVEVATLHCPGAYKIP